MIKQAIGSTSTYTITLKNSTNLPLAYTGSEPLAAVCWPGDAQATVFSPAVAWVTAPNKISLTITSANLAAVEPGIYQIRVLCGTAPNAHVVAETQVSVLPAPGAGITYQAYCSMEDLRTLFPGIDQLKTSDDLSGFQQQRSLASEWLNAMVLSKFPGNADLALLISQNKLTATKPINECVAYRTLSLVFGGRFAVKDGPSWEALAKLFEEKAERAAERIKEVSFDGGAKYAVQNAGMRVWR